MKVLTSTMILSFAMIGGAHAASPRGDTNNEPFQGTFGQQTSTVTRAQVHAELLQARAEGLPAVSEPNNMTFMSNPGTGVTRAQVAAEARRTPGATAFGDPNNEPFGAS